MSNDLRIKKPRSFSIINFHEAGEFIWWSNHLGIGMEDLLAIIHIVGNSTEAVVKYLRKKH